MRRLRELAFVWILPALSAAALLLMLPLSEGIEGTLRNVPSSIEVAPVAAGAESPPTDPRRMRELFGFPPPLTTPARRSTEPYAGRLIGTLRSTGTLPSAAAFLLPSGRSITAWVGDELLDGVIREIGRDLVVIERQGALEEVRLGNMGPARSSAAAPIQALTATDYVVSRRELMSRLSDLYGLSRQVHIVPAFRDGVPIGFRFLGLKPESELAKLGFQNGDVVKTVNGQTLQSLDGVVRLAGALDRTTSVDLELERDGRVVAHHYRLD